MSAALFYRAIGALALALLLVCISDGLPDLAERAGGATHAGAGARRHIE
jgi:hypothetical protein